jgi:hypothetical protein
MTQYLISPGAAKSGSTWLFGLLGQHSQLNMSKVKETKFFTYESEIKKDNYLKMYFSEDKDAKYYVDFSPIYLIDTSVPKKIYETLGDEVKFVFIFRNPINRLYSQYSMDKRFGFEKFDLLDAVFRPEDERVELSLNNFKHIYGNNYIGESLYDEALKRYLEYFSMEQMHIVIFEELIKNPANELEKIFDFLKIENQVDSIDLDINKGNSKVYTKNQTLIKLYVKYFSRISLVRKIVSNETIRNYLRKLIGLKYQKNPEVSPDDRKKLQDYFINSIVEFERITGKDMTIWK